MHKQSFTDLGASPFCVRCHGGPWEPLCAQSILSLRRALFGCSSSPLVGAFPYSLSLFVAIVGRARLYEHLGKLIAKVMNDSSSDNLNIRQAHNNGSSRTQHQGTPEEKSSDAGNDGDLGVTRLLALGNHKPRARSINPRVRRVGLCTEQCDP